MTDRSLKPDPNRKGSYYRRIQDIDKALSNLGVVSLPPTPAFVAYFFGCEKLAHGIVGIAAHRPATQQFSHNSRLSLRNIQSGAHLMCLNIAPSDLAWLFAKHNEQHLLIGGQASTSSRVLRNNLTHDFGPTNADRLISAAPILIPTMKQFLDCAGDVLAYLRVHFAHLP